MDHLRSRLWGDAPLVPGWDVIELNKDLLSWSNRRGREPPHQLTLRCDQAKVCLEGFIPTLAIEPPVGSALICCSAFESGIRWFQRSIHRCAFHTVFS